MTTFKLNQPGFRSLDTFLDTFFNESAAPKSNSLHFPAVNITETNDDYRLDFNVPGRKKEAFKITVDNNLLTVSFEKETDETESNIKYVKKEFITQSFKRSFTLDDKINAENIEASYENGILSLTLPKKEEVKIVPKEITVK